MNAIGGMLLNKVLFFLIFEVIFHMSENEKNHQLYIVVK